MSQSTKSNVPAKGSGVNVIVYGLDSTGKPQAAQFADRLADLALKAAAQVNLHTLQVTTPELKEIAERLPAGRITSTGRSLVPAVRQAVYDAVLQAARASGVAPVADGQPGVIPMNHVRGAGNSAGAPGLPPTWKDIAQDHLVLVQESLIDGWFEAIVVDRKDNLLTVRFRDYPKYKPFVVHADAVALLNSAPTFRNG